MSGLWREAPGEVKGEDHMNIPEDPQEGKKLMMKILPQYCKELLMF